MAQVPYAHVLAPARIHIEGAVAFNTGDPVPEETADRLGLLDPPWSLAILPAYTDDGDSVVFDEGVLMSVVVSMVNAAIAGAEFGSTISGGTP